MKTDFIRRIKNLELVRRVRDPEGEMTAFNKEASWWPERGKIQKLPEALGGFVTSEQGKILNLFGDSGNSVEI